MGLIAKLEDKLSGSSKHETAAETKKLEKQTGHTGTSSSAYQTPGGFSSDYNSSTSGSGLTSGSHGNQFDSHSDSKTHDLRHPITSSTNTTSSSGLTGSSNVGRDGYGQQSTGYPTSTSSAGGLTGSQAGYGSTQSTTDKILHGSEKRSAHQPIDPYSSSGQSAAFDHASTNPGYAGGHDTRDYGRDSYESRAGGIHDPSRTSGQETRLQSGPHSSLENTSAIPTAGGERLGAIGGGGPGGPYEAAAVSSHQGHHGSHGRDAALVGGTGAAGVGAYELGKDKHSHSSQYDNDRHTSQHDSQSGYDAQGKPSLKEKVLHPGRAKEEERQYEQQSQYPQTSGSQHSHSHAGRDAALVGGTGAAGVGAYELGKDKHSHSNQYDNERRTCQYDSEYDSQGKPSIKEKILHPGRAKEEERQYEQQSQYPQSGQSQSQYSPSGQSQSQYSPSGQSQSHHGRDAALAGGAGAAGVGAYELGKDKHSHSNQYDNEYDSQGKPSVKDKILHPSRAKEEEQRYEQQQGYSSSGTHSSQTGHGAYNDRPAQGTTLSQSQGGSDHGIGGLSLGSGSSHGANSSSSSSHGIEKKLGGAYEAGYRDALAHLEAEKNRR